MMLTIEIPEEIEAGLIAQSQARGVPVSEYISELLWERYEDVQDIQVAEVRLNDPKIPITGAELRKNLGLDC